MPLQMGDSRGLLLGFGGIAPVAAPQWPKWVNRYKCWQTSQSIRMRPREVVCRQGTRRCVKRRFMYRMVRDQSHAR